MIKFKNMIVLLVIIMKHFFVDVHSVVFTVSNNMFKHDSAHISISLFLLTILL